MRFNNSKITLAILVSTLASPTIVQGEEVKSSAEAVERIMVTGSRIQRSSAATPVPTTVLDDKQISQLGFNNAGDILNSLPAISGSLGARSGSDGLTDATAGLELANLRGLGTARTLVLINGRRHVGSSAGNTSVDLSSIPTQMIARVEVITGAAGAVYGADAVSGVVNFIMKTSYEGFKFDIKTGQTARSDGEEATLSLLTGTNFDNDKGNIMFSFDYTDRKGVEALDRTWSDKTISWATNEQYYPGSGLAQKRINHDLGFNPLNSAGYVSQGGWHSTNIGNLPTQTFNPDGTMRDLVIANCQDGIMCEGDDSFKIAPYTQLSTPTERIIASVTSHYEINDNHTLFADLKYSSTTGKNTSQGVFTDGYYGPLFEVKTGNPYLEAYQPIIDAMTEAELEAVYVNKAFDGLGRAPTKNTYDLYQFVIGSRGDLTDDIGYEFTVQHGKSKTRQAQSDAIVANLIQSMDAVYDSSGAVVCADTSGGCAPLNPFGLKSASAEAAEYIMGDFGTDGELEQTVANFNINGDLTELPAGPMQFAFGFEYRDEKSSSTPDAILIPGGLTQKTYLGGKAIVEGGYDVAEVFAELRVPLLSDKTLVQDLTFESAVRYSDYSTVGGQTSYKVGVDWVMTDEIRIRSAFGLAIRAPNVAELYKPEETQLSKITDPCSATNINAGQNTATRVANCAALGIPEGWVSFSDGGEVPIKLSGNLELEAEESSSTTLGIVLTPDAIDNFSIALDYWDIDIENAISAPKNNEILENCIDFDMADNPFCALSQRDPDTHIIQYVKNQKVNVAALAARGYDFEMDYMLDLPDATSVLFNLVASHYDKNDQLLNANKPDEIIESVGIANNPKSRGNFNITVNQQDWSAHLALNYLGSSRIALTDSDDPVYPNNHIDSVVYANFRGSYNLSETINTYVGVNNIMDQGPQQNRPSLQLGSSIYDAIGRAYYLGLTYEF